jgi:hypothetical protein
MYSIKLVEIEVSKLRSQVPLCVVWHTDLYFGFLLYYYKFDSHWNFLCITVNKTVFSAYFFFLSFFFWELNSVCMYIIQIFVHMTEIYSSFL